MQNNSDVSRRRIIQTGVWSTPVIVAAIVAPTASASSVRTIEMISEPQSVRSGETFDPITVEVRENGVAVGADEGVVFQVTSGNATFDDGTTVQITSTYEDGGATAFGLVAGAPGTVTIVVSSGSASKSLSLTITA